MTFDRAIQLEAESLFDAKADLEIFQNGTWQWLANQPTRDLVFSDRRNISALASPYGVQFSDGSRVRFLIR